MDLEDTCGFKAVFDYSLIREKHKRKMKRNMRKRIKTHKEKQKI